MTVPRLIEPCPPYTKVVSGFYDWRVINGIPAQHAGVDKSQTEDGKPMPSGALFRAAFVDGARVHFAGWGDNNTGNMVILRQGLWEARGMHLRDVVVQVGQNAPAELLLGHCDNTGLSTGTHLHFDVSAETKAEALLVQPDPVLAYGRWRVNPELLIQSEEDDDMKYNSGNRDFVFAANSVRTIRIEPWVGRAEHWLSFRSPVPSSVSLVKITANGERVGVGTLTISPDTVSAQVKIDRGEDFDSLEVSTGPADVAMTDYWQERE